MSRSKRTRVDEVSQYYEPAVKIEVIGQWLFWVIAIASLYLAYSTNSADLTRNTLEAFFITTVIIYFTLSQISRFYLVPKAERNRRKQMLSDAFGTPLSHDKTSLYYNNKYAPSVRRLGANTMENSLFSKEIAARMLIKSRWITGGYATLWLLAVTLKPCNLEVLTGITQVVFSGEIVAQWLNLEVLRLRHERTYEQLHAHFLHEVGTDSPKGIATILDSFAAYETAKASAGILLSTKIFKKINPALTEKWAKIRQELKMTL